MVMTPFNFKQAEQYHDEFANKLESLAIRWFEAELKPFLKKRKLNFKSGDGCHFVSMWKTGYCLELDYIPKFKHIEDMLCTIIDENNTSLAEFLPNYTYDPFEDVNTPSNPTGDNPKGE